MTSNERNLREEVKVLRTQTRALETAISGHLSIINDQLAKVEQKAAQLSPRDSSSEDNYEKKARAIHYIAELLGGEIKSDKTDKYSLKLNNGERIKIKFSEGGFADQKKDRPTKVWAWTGLGQQDSYERLILVGEADPQFKASYRESNSPYILFVVRASKLSDVLQGRSRLSLNVNPNTANSATANQLFNRFQMTSQELKSSCN